MKNAICTVFFITIFVVPSLLQAQQGVRQPSKDQIVFQNQYEELSSFVRFLHDQRMLGELELSNEQKSQLSMARHRMQMKIHGYHQEASQEKDPEVLAVFQQRLIEDIRRAKDKLTTDVLLPHQSELLDSFNNRRLIEFHTNTGFARINGTRFAKLDLTEKQRESLKTIQQKLQKELEAERTRHAKKLKEIRDRAVASVKNSLSAKQGDLLRLEND